MTSRRSIHLREFGRVADVQLSHDEVRELRDAGAGLRVLAGTRTGHYDVEAAEHVGTVSMKRLQVVITPKLPVARVLHLVGYALGELRLGPVGELSGAAGLVEAMQELYARALEEGLRSGVVRGYEMREERVHGVRGRVDVHALVLRRFGLAPPVDCRFDELTTDIEPNRRLLTAALRLAGAATSRPDLAAHLRRLASSFDGVSLLATGRRLAPLALDRRFDAFGPALAMAKLVLENSSVELQQGRVRSTGFLVSMNEVYEGFVVGSLRRALGLGPTTWVHHPKDLRLDEARRVALEPDALWRDAGGRPRLVLDAKYKLAPGAVSADLYQMLAYCTALGLRHGAIVYADARPARHLVRNAGVEIHVFRLDPDGEPGELSERAGRLAEQLRELAASNEVGT